jgi:hypothetical protein
MAHPGSHPARLVVTSVIGPEAVFGRLIVPLLIHANELHDMIQMLDKVVACMHVKLIEKFPIF